MPLAVSLPDGEILDEHDDRLWRQEVASRVRQHRARRRRRSDPNASLELDFRAGLEIPDGTSHELPDIRERVSPRNDPKIIEFPRPGITQPAYVPPVRLHRMEDLELAEPVIGSPRILDAPEPQPRQMDLLPAFADIQLEAEDRRRLGDVELPLQPAPLGYRLFAGLMDLMVVIIASVVFVLGFAAFAKGLPQLRVIMLCTAGVVGALWLIYQYIFLVYSSGTPGMQFAQLELRQFNGQPVPVSLRRWRALASVLSAFAGGLGYVWALVDEDTLGWHDRITQTFVRLSTPSLLAAPRQDPCNE